MSLTSERPTAAMRTGSQGARTTQSVPHPLADLGIVQSALIGRERVLLRLRPARHADELVIRDRTHPEEVVWRRSACGFVPSSRRPTAEIVNPPASLRIQGVAGGRAATEADHEFASARFMDGNAVSTNSAYPSREVAAARVIEEGRRSATVRRCIWTVAPGIAARSSRLVPHRAMLAHGNKAPKGEPRCP